MELTHIDTAKILLSTIARLQRMIKEPSFKTVEYV